MIYREISDCKYKKWFGEYNSITCTKRNHEIRKDSCKACVFYCSDKKSKVKRNMRIRLSIF